MGHGRGPDLSGAKALSGQFVAGHQANGAGEVGRSPGGLNKDRNYFKVQRTRIHLPYGVQNPFKAEVAGHQRLEMVQLGGITVE